ncbi:class F sortase [Candidatus Saccharibacteria bacterium]|nr:class F sortase [Candidatus Saccharibacteria bacterium]
MALNIYYTKESHIGRWAFLIGTVALLIISGWLTYRWYSTGEVPSVPFLAASAKTGVNKSNVTPAQLKAYTVPDNNPRYIGIPALQVDKTRVFPVKVDSNNQLEIPKNINDVGWYEKSSTPGSGGVILVDGHSAGSSLDGALAHLKTLQVGLEIVIERGDGKLFTYKVVENKSIPIEEANTTGMKIMSQAAEADKEGLNIIAADGKWVPRLGTFDRRIMLRAVIVE